MVLNQIILLPISLLVLISTLLFYILVIGLSTFILIIFYILAYKIYSRDMKFIYISIGVFLIMINICCLFYYNIIPLKTKNDYSI